MSDSHTQSYSPTPGAAKPRRKSGVLVWLLVLLLAGGAFAGALWYAGGTSALGQLGGLVDSFFTAPSGGSGGQTPAAPAPSAVTTAAPEPTLPAEAQERMFAEQIKSNVALTDLVTGEIASLKLGTPQRTESSATVPVTAVYKDGRSASGVLTFKKYQDTWYFFSLTDSKPDETTQQASPEGFDSSVVGAITSQQAQPGTQELLTDGVLDGGYRTVKVERVTMGPRTATVNVALSGGTEPPAKGRLVCISKTDGSTKYWFVASFEKR